MSNCMVDLQTPFFLVKEDLIKEALHELNDALNNTWPNYLIGYSFKTNTLPWIIKYFNDHGCCSEVVSDDEYNLAKFIGAKKIIYNGIAKGKESFLEAIKNNSIVNIDSEYEIEWLDDLDIKNPEVGIRVNFDLESRCPGQTQCGEDGERFGFCYENGELKKAIDSIKSKGVDVVGLHLHKSSKTRMPDIYRAISEVAVEIAVEYGLDLKYIDIGGGFFGGLKNKPQFIEYFELVSSILGKRFDKKRTTLIVEPGMALIGSTIDYVATVRDIKKTTRNAFAVIDGSRIHVDPLMTKKSYFYEVERNPLLEERKTICKQVVSGFTCMEHDRLFELCDEPELLPGDRIIFHKVGAYTMCLSPLFIKWFPAVYVESNHEINLIRSRWDTLEFVMGDAGEVR